MSQAAIVAIPPPPPPPPRTPSPPLHPTGECACCCCTAASVQYKTRIVAKYLNNECSWALEYAELRRGCFLNGVCEYKPPKKCQYYNVPSILQVGPTCGLTALSMLLNYEKTPRELLEEAIEHKYTYNGEMFSAQYLFELTQKHTVGAVKLYSGILNSDEVKAHLMAGSCLLVAYDADTNHMPSMLSGHKAHWAVIVGYLIDSDDKFHVMARHGKTRIPGVWPLSVLSDSNENLVEFSQPKDYADATFLLPPGGINGELGIRERAIIINGLSHEKINVA